MPQICIHLDDDHNQRYSKFFSGVGIEYALVCRACQQAPETIQTNLRDISPRRFSLIEEAGGVGGGRGPNVGHPEVLVRPTSLSFHHEQIAPSGTVVGTVSDLKPIATSTTGECVILLETGDLLRVDPYRGSTSRLMNVTETGTDLEPKWSLHLSPRGEMAAVVEARGRSGIVLDLETGRPTMTLDRGDYYPEQTDFPVAFFESDGQLRIVHGTDWNRLDISDPKTGAVLTIRSPTSHEGIEPRPQHDLDYFHGGLAISPSGDRISDDGWAWHPVGVVSSWSLRDWLSANVWESEDGPSRRDLCYRAYAWNRPLCWVDDHTLAVWGYGDDDENLIPAALIYDVETGRLIRWFAGPSGTFTFDGYLFTSSAEQGTSAWDVASGERVLHDPSFSPTCYHPGLKAFLTLTPGGGINRSRLIGHDSARDHSV